MLCKFYPWSILLILFLGIEMYDNQFKTMENQIETKEQKNTSEVGDTNMKHRGSSDSLSISSFAFAWGVQKASKKANILQYFKLSSSRLMLHAKTYIMM